MKSLIFRRRTFWFGICLLFIVGGLFSVKAFYYLRRGGRTSPGTLPQPLPQPQEAEIADVFDFPLDPDHFGPYVPYQTGPLSVDTRFGVQNPGLGREGKCFESLDGSHVPFENLYHAGEDWFAYNRQGEVLGHGAAGEPVHAVANGVVTWEQALGVEGNVLILEHLLSEENKVWSVYWHVANIQVAVGEAVKIGDVLGVVHDRSFNSHLHWEIRIFADGTSLFHPDSAGGRGTCNGYVMGVGYTWDDDPRRASPEAWGYLSPSEFVSQR